MSNDTMKEEYPEQKQRNAVCFSSWRKNKEMESKIMTKDCVSFVAKHYEIETKETGKKDRYAEIIISGIDTDRDGERMSQKAIEKMTSKLKEGVPLHSNHGKGEVEYAWEDIMGKSVDGWQKENHLVAKFKMNQSHPKHQLLWSYLNEGMPVGFSIGAKPKEAHYEEIEE